MKTVTKVYLAIMMLVFTTTVFAQTKNLKTETVKIYGNCGMCEAKIEKAGNEKNVATVDWNKDSKMATITYDAAKTSKDAILKRIALAGYDSESFLAPDDVYENLPGCCHYERELKGEKLVKNDAHKMHDMSKMDNGKSHDMSAMNMSSDMKMDKLETKMPLSEVFVQYFAVKDALIATDSKQTSASAKSLNSAIANVKMGELNNEEHMVWMEVLKNITADSKAIMDANDVKKQRDIFISLSTNFYKLAKVTNQTSLVYFMHCPMANNGKGADWLSKENEVKNPYYGSMMLGCGKVTETIK
jgi:copper chaperone CopZ